MNESETQTAEPLTCENGQGSPLREKPPIHNQLEEESRALLNSVSETDRLLNRYYIQMVDETNEASDQLNDEIHQELASLKRASSNLIRAYQRTTAMTDELGARQRDIKASRKRTKLIPAAPANASIDFEESKANHFARGINFYKLFLICFVGSFAGVIIELLWCLITNGYFESRSGLVYGPFNLLYGAGAVALTLALYRYRNRGSWISFVGGFVVGSVLEYVCSWGQELLIGSRSWDYSHMPFNLNGRICLRYSIFWGLLGVLWIKNIYPRMAKLILKLPNRAGKIISWCLVVFMVFNACVTLIAVGRWAARVDGQPANSAFWELIDKRFDNDRMERIFANMKFSE